MAGTTVTYKVTNQTQATKFDANNNPIEGKNVTFETSTGYTGTVFVPDSVYPDPNKVKDIISAQVKQVASIHNLQGSVTL